MQIGSDRRYDYDVSPLEFWAAAGRTDLFQQWWPWLQRFDADSLAEGQVWRCRVQPPLPYVVSFDLELYEVRPSTLVRVRVSGDIRGQARLDIEPAATGCRVRLRSELSPSNVMLKAVSVLARPAVTFGHNWVLDTGARQFSKRAFLAG